MAAKFLLLLTCLALPVSALAFPRSELERDNLSESKYHERIRDRYVPLPDSYQAVAGERKIALYIGNGTWKAGKQHMKRLFRRYKRSYQVVTAKDILAGILDTADFNLLAMPGGKSWKYIEELGPEGAEKIRRFVDAGGGYMGFCAGAYYATSHRLGPDPVEPYGIGLLDGVAYDGTSLHTKPFRDGMLRFDVSIPGFYPRYSQLMLGGPSFRYSAEEEASKHVRVLGWFPKIHEPAMITFNYGSGRVYLSGPHGEIEERKYLWGLVFHDQDSEWPFLNAMLTYLGGGDFPSAD
jgi:glutamine amidotransferase-like uncharacterized protein